MRIIAVAASDAQQGTLTDFEARVGEITSGGTIFLILAGGFIGVAGGLVYLIVRRWLADTGPWRGLVFGVLLFAMFGSALVSSDNPDFHLFGSPALNIAMFASLFVLFGLLVAPFSQWIERIERGLARPSLQPGGRWSLAGHAFGLFLLLPALMSFPIIVRGPAVAILLYVLAFVPLTALVIDRSVGWSGRLSDLREQRGALAAACAVLALPVAAGIALDALAVADIFATG